MEVMYVYEIIAGKRGPFPKFITGLSTGSPCSPMSQACLEGPRDMNQLKAGCCWVQSWFCHLLAR